MDNNLDTSNFAPVGIVGGTSKESISNEDVKVLADLIVENNKTTAEIKEEMKQDNEVVKQIYNEVSKIVAALTNISDEMEYEEPEEETNAAEEALDEEQEEISDGIEKPAEESLNTGLELPNIEIDNIDEPAAIAVETPNLETNQEINLGESIEVPEIVNENTNQANAEIPVDVQVNEPTTDDNIISMDTLLAQTENTPVVEAPAAPAMPETAPVAETPVAQAMPETTPVAETPVTPAMPETAPVAETPVTPAMPETAPVAETPVTPAMPETAPVAETPVAPAMQQPVVQESQPNIEIITQNITDAQGDGKQRLAVVSEEAQNNVKKTYENKVLTYQPATPSVSMGQVA